MCFVLMCRLKRSRYLASEEGFDPVYVLLHTATSPANAGFQQLCLKMLLPSPAKVLHKRLVKSSLTAATRAS